MKQYWTGETGHIVTPGLGVVPKGEVFGRACWLRRTDAGSTQRAADPGRCVLLAPSGCFLILSQTEHAVSCQNLCSFCSPILECLLLILPPVLYYIPLGVSQNGFCGSGSRNLPFQSTPTSTLCPGAFALGCKLLRVKTYVWILCLIQHMGGEGVTQSLLAKLKGNFTLHWCWRARFLTS